MTDNELFLDTDNQESKLVDWKNPPTVEDLKKDLQEALPSHRLHVDTVNEWMSALRGELKAKPMEGRSRVQPKLVRKQSEWRYAALEEPFLSTNEMFIVNPATYQDVESARQNAMILNKQFMTDIPKVAFINKFIRAAVNTGTAIVKLGWEVRYSKVVEEVPVYTQSPQETYMYMQQMVQQGQMDPQEFEQIAQAVQQGDMSALQPIQIGTEPQEVEKEIVNRPVLQVRDSRDIIIDPSCEGEFRNAQFVIDRFVSDISSLKKDGRYKNLDKINLDSHNTDYNELNDKEFASGHHSNDFKFSDRARKKLVVYEYWGYWDIDGDGITKPIVATWVGDTMIRLEENPYPDERPPFVLVQYLPPDTDTVYGDADASLLMDNQNIIGAVTRGMIDLIARSANAQQGIRKDILDPINLERFKQGRDFEFNPVGDIRGALYTTTLSEIPKSAMDVIMLQNNEAEALTGIKAFTGGISGQALGDSVGGIRSALDATAKRELGILRRLSEGMKEIGRKIIAMNSQWLSDEEVVRITDEEFVAIKRDDLAGNFDLVINVSTAEQDNSKANDLSFMLQTMGNSIPFEISQKIFAKIAELRHIPDLAKELQEYQPQPDPMQQQMAQLQMEMLQAQIENEKAKAGENMVDVELKQAKTQVELAKAGKSKSEAEKIDLDYVEQATGVKHEREMEKLIRNNESREESKVKFGG